MLASVVSLCVTLVLITGRNAASGYGKRAVLPLAATGWVFWRRNQLMASSRPARARLLAWATSLSWVCVLRRLVLTICMAMGIMASMAMRMSTIIRTEP